MSISNSDLKAYKPVNNNNTLTNGGRMSVVEYTSGLSDDFFRNISEPERVAGVTRYAKVFLRNISNSSSLITDFKAFLADITPLAGVAYLFEATATDQQGDITGLERKYSVGRLNANILAGGTSLVVDFELGMGAKDVVQVGDTIYISNGTQEEFNIVTARTWTVDQVAITVQNSFINNYAVIDNSVCASVIKKSNIKANFNNFVVTSTAGVYDSVANPLILDWISTIEQTWTLTFTSATAFSISGNTVGSMGTGSTLSNTAPINSDWALPFFTLPAAGFSGTYAAGDNIVFDTHSNATPLWFALELPANMTIGTELSNLRQYEQGN